MTRVNSSAFADAEDWRIAAADGAQLPVYALGGPAHAPGLLFGHANGLAAGSYEPWLRDLARTARVFAFDARGHGRSHWPDGPLDEVFHVDRFADDLALVADAVLRRLGGGALHYAGHSLNAAAALRLAARGGTLPWSGGTLFEPPIFPPPDSRHYVEACAKQTPLIERSAQRRAEWRDADALFAALRRRDAFARFRPDMLAAHCRATLRPLAGGGCRLCCPPAVESAVFRSHRAADTWQRLTRAKGDIHLVSGDPNATGRGWVSVCMPDMAALLPQARLTTLPRTSHMMIFEAPERSAELVLEALNSEA